MVDFPATSEFLTSEERAYVIWKKSRRNLYLLTSSDSHVDRIRQFISR